MSLFVKKAYEVAKNAHQGQVDKAGIDYFKHPEAVASFVKTDDEKVVAYLHDVIEDTNLTLSDLEAQGFSSDIINAVEVLTKKKGQPYQTYLQSVKKNELARVVKLADLKHNSDLSRLTNVTTKDIERHAKYQSAIEFLST